MRTAVLIVQLIFIFYYFTRTKLWQYRVYSWTSRLILIKPVWYMWKWLKRFRINATTACFCSKETLRADVTDSLQIKVKVKDGPLFQYATFCDNKCFCMLRDISVWNGHFLQKTPVFWGEFIFLYENWHVARGRKFHGRLHCGGPLRSFTNDLKYKTCNAASHRKTVWWSIQFCQ